MAGSLGARIRYLRHAKNYTQRDLAQQMGVSTQAVSKWENDVSYPDIMLLYLLSQVLSITLDELLCPDTESRT